MKLTALTIIATVAIPTAASAEFYCPAKIPFTFFVEDDVTLVTRAIRSGIERSYPAHVKFYSDRTEIFASRNDQDRSLYIVVRGRRAMFQSVGFDGDGRPGKTIACTRVR